MNPNTALTPRTGSSLYYCLLYATPDQRSRFLATLSLIRTISECLYDVQEPAVAQTKIHWWHEELERLYQGSALHPTAQRCQQTFTGREDLRHACLRILSAASSERFETTTTDAELNSLLRKDYGARLALLEHSLLSESTESNQSHSKQKSLSLALAGVRRLQMLPQLLHRGYTVFSDERYRKFDITPTNLVRQNSTATSGNREKVDALLNFAIAEALDAMQSAQSALELVQKQTELFPLTVLIELRTQQLRLWHKRHPNLLREYLTLTPLRKFALTWLAHRRSG